jgi:hypothetical protein
MVRHERTRSQFCCGLFWLRPKWLSLSLPQHPDQHRPQDPVLLAVDQELSKGAALRVASLLAIAPAGRSNTQLLQW